MLDEDIDLETLAPQPIIEGVRQEYLDVPKKFQHQKTTKLSMAAFFFKSIPKKVFKNFIKTVKTVELPTGHIHQQPEWEVEAEKFAPYVSEK